MTRIVRAVSVGAALAWLAGCGGIPAATGISEPGAPNAVSPSWTEVSLHSFDFTDGAYNIYAGLVFDAAGNLYGTTQMGGDGGCDIVESCGVVFELTRGANGKWREKVLHAFFPGDPLGFWPRAGLVLDAKGNLYGSASGGGTYCSGSVNCGTIFELSPSGGTWTQRVLYAFKGGPDGSSPEGNLTFDTFRAVGNLYGTTAEGGRKDEGTVFELSPRRSGFWAITTLHSFTSREGDGPEGRLTFDKTGSLYGTNTYGGAYRSGCGFFGCGTAFRLTRAANGTWALKVLHTFGKGDDGVGPVSALTVDSAGNLFGVAAQGGAHSALVPRGCLLYGCGAVYELARAKGGRWIERIIHNFGVGTDGNLPRGDLILDKAGSLYGTTVLGGRYGGGNAFRLSRSADGKWREEVLHDFGSGDDGVSPYSGMIFDRAHNLYGTTDTGGSYRSGSCEKSGGCGTVFEIKP